MIKLEFQGVNTNKLHDELITSGIMPQLVESKDGITQITVDDSKVDAVNAIVAVHDSTPVPVQPPLELRNRADIDYIAIMTGVEL